MTIVSDLATSLPRSVTGDLYRDIHKAIRSELFTVTGSAGNIDPADRDARLALAAHVDSLVGLLVSHAEHEDVHIQPVMEVHLPALAASVEADHRRLEARVEDLRVMASDAVDAPTAWGRPLVHRLYMELASFTSAYLVHQDTEERVIMPQLEEAVGAEATGAIHGAIVSSIPPLEMARSLALMLPAMNIDDRTELLGGMQAGAPPEVFAGVWDLAGTVLSPADHAALGRRLAPA